MLLPRRWLLNNFVPHLLAAAASLSLNPAAANLKPLVCKILYVSHFPLDCKGCEAGRAEGKRTVSQI